MRPGKRMMKIGGSLTRECLYWAIKEIKQNTERKLIERALDSRLGICDF